MEFQEDIIRKIHTDFGKNSNEAFEILNNAIEKTEYLKTDRVIRCIIFLSKGDLSELHRYIDSATYDTRDVMFWAEYKKKLNGNTSLKRIRDFNNTFEESTTNVKE